MYAGCSRFSRILSSIWTLQMYRENSYGTDLLGTSRGRPIDVPRRSVMYRKAPIPELVVAIFTYILTVNFQIKVLFYNKIIKSKSLLITRRTVSFYSRLAIIHPIWRKRLLENPLLKNNKWDTLYERTNVSRVSSQAVINFISPSYLSLTAVLSYTSTYHARVCSRSKRFVT